MCVQAGTVEADFAVTSASGCCACPLQLIAQARLLLAMLQGDAFDLQLKFQNHSGSAVICLIPELTENSCIVCAQVWRSAVGGTTIQPSSLSIPMSVHYGPEVVHSAPVQA